MPYWFDGNNLIGLSASAAQRERKTTRAFLELLSGYALARGGRFIVFFDGDDATRCLPPRGVRVRYSAPFSADNAILEHIRGSSTPGDIIVVTNDHALAGRCRDAGAKTMGWSGFIARMGSAPPKFPRGASKEEKIDVEEWSRYFGIDPGKL